MMAPIPKPALITRPSPTLYSTSSYRLALSIIPRQSKKYRDHGRQQRHHSSINTAPKRDIHASTKRPSTAMMGPQAASQESKNETSPLAVLPLQMVLRSAIINTISASPWLLPPALAIMSRLAHTQSPVLNPDRNPILRWLLKKTFYAQFCAGENPVEVNATISRLKDIGFSGVILGYAREVVLTEAQTRDLSSCGTGALAEECIRTEIRPWAEGTLETVRLAQEGDFVALKFTGAGRQALYHLSEDLPPSADLRKAIDEICELAASRGVRLLFDAEQQAVQKGIDSWTIEYMRKFNTTPGRATIYGTYQAYLKSTPHTLSKHLKMAQDGGFTLGVKLVRGAYLGSDPRELMHDTKAQTDQAYDGIARSLLTRQWADGGPMAGSGPYPSVCLVLASHNAESVRKARGLCESGNTKTDVAFAQLQGMADEVSCELVSARRTGALRDGGPGSFGTPASPLQAYKYLVWGSTGECMKYLLRRAQENRDAVQRTRSGRDAMIGEVRRRFWKAVTGN